MTKEHKLIFSFAQVSQGSKNQEDTLTMGLL